MVEALGCEWGDWEFQSAAPALGGLFGSSRSDNAALAMLGDLFLDLFMPIFNCNQSYGV